MNPRDAIFGAKLIISVCSAKKKNPSNPIGVNLKGSPSCAAHQIHLDHSWVARQVQCAEGTYENSRGIHPPEHEHRTNPFPS